MNYDLVKKLVFAVGIVKDGYNGALADAKFAFDEYSGKVFAVFPFGCATAVSYPVKSKQEALAALKNQSNVVSVSLL